MIRALFAKAFRDAKLLFACLLALMFFFPWLFVWTSSKVNLPAFSEFLANALPQKWERLSGVSFSEIATPAGRVALVFVHPLIDLSAIAWAVARGSDCVSGEIGRGSMELLLAQPVSRTAVYSTQALVTILGSATLAIAAWCGTAMGVGTVSMPDQVSMAVFVAPAVNLFGLMVCLGGMSALASSWDSQRWRTIGLMGAWYALAVLLKVVGRVAEGWQWANYASFLSAYEPQAMAARPAEAWAVFAYQDGAVVGLGLGGQQLVLLGLGLVCYAAGAIIFNRREIPAPL
jgi:ABC-2 type transport system permease protein